MESFLRTIASYYSQEYKTKISDFCFVFPGRRAGLFFEKHLKECFSSNEFPPIFLPKIITLEKFYEELTEIETEDALNLSFELYLIYKSNPLNTASFDTFYQISETIISDFDDIDKYLADAKTIFSNITELNDLTDITYNYLSDVQKNTIRKFWKNFKYKDISQTEEIDNHSFHSIFHQLPWLYKTFKEQLIAKNVGYEGLIQRTVAEKIKKTKDLKLNNELYVFIGFNALNKCEKTLFDHLKNLNKAHFFWDYSNFLMNTNNIGNKYIRENLYSYPMPINFKATIEKETRKFPIRITSVSSASSQTQIVSHFLKDISKDVNKISTNPDEIGIILADENLLLPTLYSIPNEYPEINVTMGYPLKNSSITSFLTQIILLHKNKQTKNDSYNFYYKNLLGILDHQLISLFPFQSTIKTIKSLIISNNIIRIESNTIKVICQNEEINQKGVIYFFETLLNSKNLPFSEYLPSLLHFLYQSEQNIAKLDRELIYHHYKAINKINSNLYKYNLAVNDDLWIRMYQKISSRLSVPFKGEPLKGVQIMGLMETRALDFKNLLILGLNEGIFPSTSRPNSFILHNLRKGYDLPTFEHRNSIFAYYFFRLLKHAENIELVYSTESTETSASEMSRFLYQLIYSQEVTKLYVGHESNLIKQIPNEIRIEKSNNIKRLLINKLEDPNYIIYPTTLTKYFECKLSFYFASILKLKETDTVDETIDSRIYGLIVHKTMENIYKDYLNTNITETIFKTIWAPERVQDSLKRALSEIAQTNQILNDENILKNITLQIINEQLKGLMHVESKSIPYRVLSVEQNLNTKIAISEDFIVQLGGNIDRIDIQEDKILVIDYKTGKASPNLENLQEIFESKNIKQNKALIQTLLYCLIVSKNNLIDTKNFSILPAIIQTKELFSNDYNPLLLFKNKDIINYKNSGDEGNVEFETTLRQILHEIFLSDTPFTQTTDGTQCTYCAYKNICIK